MSRISIFGTPTDASHRFVSPILVLQPIQGLPGSAISAPWPTQVTGLYRLFLSYSRYKDGMDLHIARAELFEIESMLRGLRARRAYFR